MAAQPNPGPRRKTLNGSRPAVRRGLFLGLPASVIADREHIDPTAILAERGRIESDDGKERPTAEHLRALDRSLAYLIAEQHQRREAAIEHRDERIDAWPEPPEDHPAEYGAWCDRWHGWQQRIEADALCEIGLLTHRRVALWAYIAKLTGEAPPDDLHVHRYDHPADPGDDPGAGPDAG